MAFPIYCKEHIKVQGHYYPVENYYLYLARS
jgi:hypothetical protein